MDTNKEWLDQLMATYTNMNNPVSEPVAETKEEVLNEECTECNESADPCEDAYQDCIEEVNAAGGDGETHGGKQRCIDKKRKCESVKEEVEEVEELEEETSNEDFMVSLLEDVQAAVGEDLTEEEIEAILETVSLVVEGMVKKMKNKN